jgi:hypothetical protein
MKIRETLELHYSVTVKALAQGRVIPFLGAGINLCDRPIGAKWTQDQYLPSGGELTEYLIKSFDYPRSEAQDLMRVSQYIDVTAGSGPLYEELRRLFDIDYPITSVHQSLAALPALLRKKGYNNYHQVIITTNYDDVLERALREADEPFDVVSYVAEGEYKGKFLHRLNNGQVEVIERPNEYRGLPLNERSIIFKIHGAIDRINEDQDSYVITEDHYIEYLTRTDISNLIPVTLMAKMRRSHFLFLGYGLRDWNLRVILHRIWGEQKLTYKSWAIQLDPDDLDQKFWIRRGVEIISIRLEEYISDLNHRLQKLPNV